MMKKYKKNGYFNFKDNKGRIDKKEVKKSSMDKKGEYKIIGVKDFNVKTKDSNQKNLKAYEKKQIKARIVKYEIKD